MMILKVHVHVILHLFKVLTSVVVGTWPPHVQTAPRGMENIGAMGTVSGKMTIALVTHWLSQFPVMAVPLRVNLEEWVSIEEKNKSIKMEDQCGRWRVVHITFISTVF